MRNKTWIGCIILLVIANVCWFWPGNLYFLNDDLLHIPLTDKGYLFQTNSVRPVHEILVWLELKVWGKNPFGYHLTALLLYFIALAQVYDLCLLMQSRWLGIDKKQALMAALLTVVLVLAYPQSSESLGWILGRTSVLSAIFFMITARMFFTFNFSTKTYLAGAFFFTAALFAYEQIILMPAAFAWIAFTEKNKELKRNMFRFVSVLLIVVAGYLFVRKIITSEVIGEYEGSNFLTLRWGTLAANFLRISFRLFLNPQSSPGFIYSTGVFLFLLIAVVLFVRKKVSIDRHAFIFFLSIILLLMLPVISLGVAVNSFESGRYLFLPSVFLIIGISIGSIAAFYQNRQVKLFFCGLLFVTVCYWFQGKYTASQHYREASAYAKTMNDTVEKHFKTSSDTLVIDTLQVSVHRLPVFRLGFMTGVKWLNNTIDTNKIIVRNYADEIDFTGLNNARSGSGNKQ